MRHSRIWLLLLFLSLVPSQVVGAKYHRNYSWGKIKTINNLCLQEYYGKLQFRQCDNNVSEQQWMITGTGNLRHRLSNNIVSDSCIDLPTEHGEKTNTELQMYHCNDSDSMKWRFTSVNNTFQITSQGQPARCLSNNGVNKNVSVKLCSRESTFQNFVLISADNKDALDAFPHAALQKNNISYENWMYEIYRDSPSTLLKDIVIPGTHNSATYRGFSSISTTQSHSIDQQLMNGIRFFDLRVDKRSNGLVITHGLENGPDDSLTRTLSAIKTFAINHHREIIFISFGEIPHIKNEQDNDGYRNVYDLAFSIIDHFGKILFVSDKHAGSVTIGDVWDSHHNVIILIKNYSTFAKAVSDPQKLVWNAQLSFRDKWPDESNFIKIGSILEQDLRNNYGKWHMSQLIRTPRITDVFRTFGQVVYRMTTETTIDGQFNFSIGQWLTEWVKQDNLHPNFVETDFYHLSNLVPVALTLNLAQRR